MTKERLISFLHEECRMDHYYCMDPWYSCPKAESGCTNDDLGEECNCGAEQFNKKLDEVIKEIRIDGII